MATWDPHFRWDKKKGACLLQNVTYLNLVATHVNSNTNHPQGTGPLCNLFYLNALVYEIRIVLCIYAVWDNTQKLPST